MRRYLFNFPVSQDHGRWKAAGLPPCPPLSPCPAQWKQQGQWCLLLTCRLALRRGAKWWWIVNTGSPILALPSHPHPQQKQQVLWSAGLVLKSPQPPPHLTREVDEKPTVEALVGEGASLGDPDNARPWTGPRNPRGRLGFPGPTQGDFFLNFGLAL